MRSRLLALGPALLLGAGCKSDFNLHTHAFSAPSACGQGPYDLHFPADGKTGEEGVEIVACTPHRLAGQVAFWFNDIELANRGYGDVADNQRCVAGAGVVTATAPAATAGVGHPGGAGAPAGPAATAPTLIERGWDDEDPFPDHVCGKLGLVAQQVLMTTVLSNSPEVLRPGADLHVRLWSDAPNDLAGVIFLVRHATSNHTKAELAKEEAEHAHDTPTVPSHHAPPPPDHGPPPPPLTEERPPLPSASASWVPGYWTWTGSAWGWLAGGWRELGRELPPPQVELPGAPPVPAAIWIAGSWRVSAGGYVWISGRWRR
jgi:hypothetical protein